MSTSCIEWHKDIIPLSRMHLLFNVTPSFRRLCLRGTVNTTKVLRKEAVWSMPAYKIHLHEIWSHAFWNCILVNWVQNSVTTRFICGQLSWIAVISANDIWHKWWLKIQTWLRSESSSFRQGLYFLTSTLKQALTNYRTPWMVLVHLGPRGATGSHFCAVAPPNTDPDAKT